MSSRSADRRSPEALAWRPLYKTARWAEARALQLAKRPLCEECELQQRVTPATVVNHRIPHKGDLVLFWDPTNHQSVCKPHHDGLIARTENLGFSPAVDDGGWPVDPKHPVNRTVH